MSVGTCQKVPESTYWSITSKYIVRGSTAQQYQYCRNGLSGTTVTPYTVVDKARLIQFDVPKFVFLTRRVSRGSYRSFHSSSSSSWGNKFWTILFPDMLTTYCEGEYICSCHKFESINALLISYGATTALPESTKQNKTKNMLGFWFTAKCSHSP